MAHGQRKLRMPTVPSGVIVEGLRSDAEISGTRIDGERLRVAVRELLFAQGGDATLTA